MPNGPSAVVSGGIANIQRSTLTKSFGQIRTREKLTAECDQIRPSILRPANTLSPQYFIDVSFSSMPSTMYSNIGRRVSNASLRSRSCIDRGKLIK